MSTPIEFSFSDKQNWLYRHSFEDDDNVDKPYTVIEEDTKKKEDENRPIEVGGRRVVCAVLPVYFRDWLSREERIILWDCPQEGNES